MKTRLLVTALVALCVLMSQPVHAQDNRELVGIWQITTTMNGYFEHEVMTLRANGTGHHAYYATGRKKPLHGEFTWTRVNGGILFFYPKNDTGRARLRLVDANHMILTPADIMLQPIGPDLLYERQVNQNDQGC